MRKFLNWSIQITRDINNRISSCLGGLIFPADITDEDYEKLHWGDLFQKIEEEPNNPYNYYYRGNMRINKARNNRLGVIEDFTQVTRIILTDREKYPDINLVFCYFTICRNANIHGNILMEKKDFIEAIEYYYLSISNCQEYLECEDRNIAWDDSCKFYREKSYEQIKLIQDLTKDARSL